MVHFKNSLFIYVVLFLGLQFTYVLKEHYSLLAESNILAPEGMYPWACFNDRIVLLMYSFTNFLKITFEDAEAKRLLIESDCFRDL